MVLGRTKKKYEASVKGRKTGKEFFLSDQRWCLGNVNGKRYGSYKKGVYKNGDIDFIRGKTSDNIKRQINTLVNDIKYQQHV